MADNAELVIFGSEEEANKSAKGLPIPHKSFRTCEAFKYYFERLPEYTFIILLFLSPYNGILNPVLEEIKSKRQQVIHVLVSGDHPINKLTDITFVSELLLTYKLKASFARFLDAESTRQIDLNNIEFSKNLYEQRTKILEHVDENDKLEPCHILLIPSNATPKDVHIAQQRLKQICYELYGAEYEFNIRTLFDYIPEDEMDAHDENYTAYLQKRYKGNVCHTIMESSLIRLYVVGNKTCMHSSWSKQFITAEANINEEHTLKYVDRCSFITNERHANQTSDNLVRLFDRDCQIRQVNIKTLDEVRDDIHFQDILPRIYGRLENRKMIINSKAYQQSSVGFENIARYSNKIRPITQAQNSPGEKQDGSDIIRKILFNQ